VVNHRRHLGTGDPEPDLRAGAPLLESAVVAVQGDTPVAVGRPGNHRLGDVAGQLLRSRPPALGRPQDLE
jgi:hypothetical protein